jgi:hypothetical protein
VLAFLGDRLDLLRLPRQIGVGDLLVPQSDRGLMGQHRHDDSADRARAPRSEPPERSPVELILLGQKAGQQTAGIFDLEAAGQIVGIPRHATFRPSRAPPNHATNINRKCACILKTAPGRQPGFHSGSNTL